GDLHFRNILLRYDATQEAQFTIIDCPKGRRPLLRPVFERARVHDLACLDKHASKWLTRTDRLRFLRAYLGQDRLPRERLPWMRKIQRRAAELMRRRERKLLATS
ncbi:MAG: hypothetical protein KDB53_20280, partial [Planctomycetes bacterium]|nr:hypothetical protein [Planctomycetota bacterium]